MPLYEYLCHDCNKELELLVQASEKATCPECGNQRLTRLLSVVASPGRDSGANPSRGASSAACGSNCACHPHG